MPETTLTSSSSSLTPLPVSIRINIFWFLSLTLSLTTVLIGILCKQWLREYQRSAPVSHHVALELRQMRFESLEMWNVPAILASLPLLLQLTLVSFFAGLLDLLRSLNGVVAGFVACVVRMGVIATGVMTVLPTFYTYAAFPIRGEREVLPGGGGGKINLPCPFKLPQSWLFHRLIRLLPVPTLPTRLFRSSPKNNHDNSSNTRSPVSTPPPYTDWVTYDLHSLRTHRYLQLHHHHHHHHLPGSTGTGGTGTGSPNAFLLRGLRWMVQTFGDSARMARHLFHCLQSCEVMDAGSAVCRRCRRRDGHMVMSSNGNIDGYTWADGVEIQSHGHHFGVDIDIDMDYDPKSDSDSEAADLELPRDEVKLRFC